MFNLLNKINMKKINKLLFITGITVSVMLLNACVDDADKDSYGLSKVTVFPTLELLGDAEYWTVKGASFQDPGYKAEYNAGDVVVSGSVDTNVPGFYELSYTAKNEEGYSVTVTRKVFVADIANGQTGLEGTYTSNVHRVADTGAASDRGPFNIALTAVPNIAGHYYIIDLLGGWYVIGGGASYANYGYKGYIRVDQGGDITFLWSGTTPWGDEAILAGGQPGHYDAASNTLTWASRMSTAAYTFNVTLVKQ
jgi:hypothetical protein